MKKFTKNFLSVIIAGLAMASFLPAVVTTEPTHAAKCTCTASGKEGVTTAILGEPGTDKDNNPVNCSCDDGSGSSIMHVLNRVAAIMTIGIGILGAIGLTVSGIQYITAGGNEEQTRKARRRIFEIVIGLLAYVLIYAALYWLLPEFKGLEAL